MTKVGPELGNAVRELAGQMVKLNSKHWWAVRHVVGYVTYEPFQGVIFQKPRIYAPIFMQTQITPQMKMTKGVSQVE